MNEEDIIIGQDLIDAYNAGYTLQKHEPELLNTILQSRDRQGQYIKALAQGKQQYEREIIMQKQIQIKQKEKKRKR